MHGGERTEFDEKIDAALRRYAEAAQFSEPRVALALVRALAGQDAERPRGSVWAWVVPSLVAAALIAVALVWVLRVPQTPQIAWTPKAPGVAGVGTSANRQSSGAKAPNLSERISARLKSCPATHGCEKFGREMAVASVRRLPKQEVFPTLTPLPPEEQALAAFVNQAPAALKEQMVAAQKHMDDPIELAAIQIDPLDKSSEKPQTKGRDVP